MGFTRSPDDLISAAAEAYLAQAAGWPAVNLSTADTHVIFTGPGVVHSVTVNTPALASTVEVYDGEDDTGVLLATIDTATATGAFVYDLTVTDGLAVVITGTPDITVAARAA